MSRKQEELDDGLKDILKENSRGGPEGSEPEWEEAGADLESVRLKEEAGHLFFDLPKTAIITDEEERVTFKLSKEVLLEHLSERGLVQTEDSAVAVGLRRAGQPSRSNAEAEKQKVPFLPLPFYRSRRNRALFWTCAWLLASSQ